MKQVPIITVDGPSGSGKGTLCAKLAQSLNFHVLDSGALYRIVGLFAHKAGYITKESNASLDDSILEENLVQLVASLNIQFVFNEAGQQKVVVNDSDVTHEIRTETCGAYASIIAPFPRVRSALLDLQHNFAKPQGLIADGRDMGTVIFPNAQLKVFLTASAKKRAERRVKQLQDMGQSANIAAILADIKARDERDENRKSSPSKPAEDALVLDSSVLSAEEVYTQVFEAWQKTL